MALRLAKLKTDGDGIWWVAYDSVTLYVYPVAISTKKELYAFLSWFEEEFGVPFNGYNGSHYNAYEVWIAEGKPSTGRRRT